MPADRRHGRTARRPPRRRGAPDAGRLRAALGRWEALLVGLLARAGLVGPGLSPEFLTTDSFTTGSLDLSEVALMALPLTLVDRRGRDRPVGRLRARRCRAR